MAYHRNMFELGTIGAFSRSRALRELDSNALGAMLTSSDRIAAESAAAFVVARPAGFMAQDGLGSAFLTASSATALDGAPAAAILSLRDGSALSTGNILAFDVGLATAAWLGAGNHGTAGADTALAQPAPGGEAVASGPAVTDTSFSGPPGVIDTPQANETFTVTQTTVLAPGGDTDGDGVIDPGETVLTTVTITNNSTDTAATGVSFSETLAGMTLVGVVNVSPIAVNDSFTAVGNTQLLVGGATGLSGPSAVLAGNLLANDFNVTGDGVSGFTLTSVGAFATSGGGTVTINADGSFAYNPAAGFAGNDTFTYTIRDAGLDGIAGNADDLSSTATATVTITTANTVWYVDAAYDGSNGASNGTSARPFTTLAQVNGAGGAGDVDVANQTIYVRGNHTADFVMESSQRLIGSGSDLVVGGYTLASAGVNNTLSHSTGIGVLLNTLNTLSGFNIVGTNAAGTGIADNNGSVGVLVVTNVNVTGSGQAIDIDQGGMLSAAFGTVSSTGSASNGVHLQGVSGSFSATGGQIETATGVGFLIGASGGGITNSGGAATISYGGNFLNNGGASIEIQDRTGGTVTFSGTMTEGAGQGIVADGNAGTINFSGQIFINSGASDAIVLTNNSAAMNFTPGGTGLDITTTTGRGFIVDGGGGTVTLTGSGNTVATTSGRAVEIDNVTIGGAGVTFLSVGVSDGVTTTGIFLNNAGSGGFTITGTGSTGGSGGTISSIDGGADGNVEQGIGIYINNTNNISLSNMNILGDFANFGIRGVNVNNFTLRDSSMNSASLDDGGFGNSNAADEGAISFTNLTGTALFEGNNLSDGHEDVLVIDNSSGTLNLTVRDSANDQAFIGRNGTTTGNDGILVNTSGTASVTALIEGVDFQGSRGDMIQFNASGTATQNITIRNNTMHNAHPDIVSGGGGVSITGGAGTGAGYNVTYRVEGNSMRGAEGTMLFINHLGDAGTVSGSIINNTIGVNNGVHGAAQADTGSNNGGNGIFIGLEHGTGAGNLTHAVLIQGNNIGDITTGAGIFLRANGDGVSGAGLTRLEATIRNNVIDEMGVNSLAGIYAQVGGAGASDDGLMGLNIENNNINLTGATNSIATMVFDDLSSNGQFYFPGYAGPYDDAGLRAFHSGPEGNTLTHPAGTGSHVITSPTGTFATGNAFVLTVPSAAEHLSPKSAADWEAELRLLQSAALDEHLASLIADEASLVALAQALAAQVSPAAINPIDPTPHAGETISVGPFTLPNGQSVTIQWRATIDAQNNGLIVNPVNSGTVTATNAVGFPDLTTGTVTTNLDTLTLGGQVWNDNGAGGGTARNGARDGAEAGIDGLTVELFVDSNNDNVADTPGTALLSTTTAGGGLYSFAGLAPGNYIVRVTPGSLISSPGGVDPDNNVDNDDNGTLVGGFVVSNAITLAYNTEPTAGTGNDTNNTLDFALVANQPPVANDDNVSVAEDSGANDLTAALLANDTDPEDDTRTITSATQGSFGTVSLVGGVLTYTPNGNYNGSDSFTYTISDGNGNTDTATANITVTAVNDPVTGTAPATVTVTEDTTDNAITGMSISDIDSVLAPAGVYEVTLSATNGVLTLTTVTGLTFTAGDGGGDTVMTFHGTLADLNTALATARYTPDPNYSGSAQIQLQVTDTFGGVVATGAGSATNDTDTIAVTVTGVNDAPEVDLNGAAAGVDNTASYTEQAPVVTLAPDIVLTDIDSATLTGATVQITSGFVPLAGDGADYLGINGSGAGTISGITYSYSASTGILTLSGTASVAAYQAVLAQVTFQSTTNNPGASKTVTWTVNDGSANSTPVTTTIAVTEVNDAPVNSVPGPQNGTEDTNLVFSTANGNAIIVSDPDATTLTVALSVNNGVLTLSGTAGLSFTVGDGTGDATMTFTGTKSAINAALNGLIYRGNLNYEGADSLTITTIDNGQTGTGGGQGSASSIAITLADDGVINGDAGNNTLSGTPGNDFFDLRQGGDDNVSGGGGNDGFYFGGAYTGADVVDGGTGSLDQIGLQGDYSGGVTLGTLTGVELVVLLSGGDTRFGDTANNFYDYNITSSDAAVVAGQRLIIQANMLRAGEDFTFNGSAETDGSFLIYGGRGVDNLTGGAGNDGFFFGDGRFGASDVVNGGGGNMDQLGLQGNFTITFGPAQLSGLEFIVLLSAGDNRFGANGGTVSYDLTMNNANVAAGQTMVVSATTLTATETLAFRGFFETNGSFQIFSGRGDDFLAGGQLGDIIFGGAGDDFIEGQGGGDQLTGGAGNDTFHYLQANHSAPGNRDHITDFTLGDRIDLTGLSINTGGGNFSFIGGGAQTGARQVQVIQNGNTATVNVFIDGDATADMVIDVTVADGHTLTAADFVAVTAQQPQPVKADSGEADGLLIMDMSGPDMFDFGGLGGLDDAAGLAASSLDGAKGYLDIAFARDSGGPAFANLLDGEDQAESVYLGPQDDLAILAPSHDLTL